MCSTPRSTGARRPARRIGEPGGDAAYWRMLRRASARMDRHEAASRSEPAPGGDAEPAGAEREPQPDPAGRRR